MDRLYEVRGPCNLSFVTVARVVTFDRVSNENLFRGIFNFRCFLIFLSLLFRFCSLSVDEGTMLLTIERVDKVERDSSRWIDSFSRSRAVAI